MCRLFGLHAGRDAVTATFWLLKAPDSLQAQSHRAPDGTGIGVFNGPGTPVVSKQPMAAWHDAAFASSARTLEGTTFLAHVRYASTGAHTLENTHPFELDGRLFAHNGVVHGLDRLDARILERGGAGLVRGETDSERLFALITAETRLAGGDLGAGLAAAMAWVVAALPVYSLNLIITTGTGLWALRYPETHGLYVLERRPGGHGRGAQLQAGSPRIHAHSPSLANQASLVVASEPMDADPGWRLLGSGEMLQVDAGLAVTSTFPLPEHPAFPLALADLGSEAAASQHPHAAGAA
ncbi:MULTISPECIES: class II glutamine amidotransferase [unclassified Arthrobacter]|uniref:class II glutamine amidotransferase n=1 Tax=unclassified Arthrobacter TaxID=235627 RepID=UPI00159DD099|nr:MULTISPECIES: class II glutamine amidotransferase [unclassified Arthrobacter]MCQ9163839.1 class II glutamine amidotransferase [Arthrobacter sp. STN4]NVM99991.1 class II glutamine amidotransferase [Arthrobacter sp. SDTb3-6]